MNTSKRRTVSNAVIVLIVIAILIPVAIFAVPQVVGAEHSYTVLSGSMAPTIKAGDVVIVNEVSPKAIEEGDIITFRRGERAMIKSGQGINLITHRVIDVVPSEKGPMFETKGDANEDPDSQLVPPDALIGRVMFTIPYIGHLIVFVSKPLGFITLVAVPLGLLVLGELYDLARAARNSREANDAPTEPDEQAETDGGMDADEWVAADETESEDG